MPFLQFLPLQALLQTEAQENAKTSCAGRGRAQIAAYGHANPGPEKDQTGLSREDRPLHPRTVAHDARFTLAQIWEKPSVCRRIGVPEQRKRSFTSAGGPIHSASVALVCVAVHRRRAPRGYSVRGRAPRRGLPDEVSSWGQNRKYAPAASAPCANLHHVAQYRALGQKGEKRLAAAPCGHRRSF